MKFELDENDLKSTVSELRAGLQSLTPIDNFKGFLWEGTITANTEVIIPNKMVDRSVPKYFNVLSISGVNDLVKGVAPWTNNYVTLKNHNATTDLTAIVLFFR